MNNTKKVFLLSLIISFVITLVFFVLYRVAIAQEPQLALKHALTSLSQISTYSQNTSLIRTVSIEIPILEFEGNLLPKDTLVADLKDFEIDFKNNTCSEKVLEEMQQRDCLISLQNYVPITENTEILQKLLEDQNAYEFRDESDILIYKINDSVLKQFMLDKITEQLQNQIIQLSGDDIQFEQIVTIKPDLNDVIIEFGVSKTDYILEYITFVSQIGFTVEFNAKGSSIDQILQFDADAPTAGRILIKDYRQKDMFIFNFDDTYKSVNNPIRLLLGI